MNKHVIFFGVVLVLSGCGAADIMISGRGEMRWPPHPKPAPEERTPDRPQARYASNSNFIPPGHVPPPGSCKVWNPGQPPGHQGPAQACEAAFYRVQPGQVIVRRSDYDHNIVELHKAYVYRNELYFEVESYPMKSSNQH